MESQRFEKMTIRPGSSSRANNVRRGNSLGISTFGECGPEKAPHANRPRMILVHKRRNKLPGIILLRKKPGGYPPWAHFQCQTPTPALLERLPPLEMIVSSADCRPGNAAAMQL